MQVEETLSRLKYAGLNPMQSKVVGEGFMDADRALVCAPTASGKTLLAILKLVQNYEKTGRKAFYVVPLKALAQEKFDEFTAILAQFGMKVASATSDYDSSTDELFNADVIILTIEKLDSILRHKPSWLSKTSLAIVDEVHLLNDDSRGSTLEVVLVKLFEQECNVVALSATIANPEEVAQWLNAKLFQSDYRPTKLVYGIAYDDKLQILDKQAASSRVETLASKQTLREVLKRCLSQKGQAIVFVNSRRSAESTAEDLAALVEPFLGEGDKPSLTTISQKALKTFHVPTVQCRKLSGCLSKGISFHHAGLVGKQRTLVEQGFKQDRSVKVIVATTTLAMGVDMPATYVIVKDVKRFTGAFSEFLPNFEIQQILGRSGRPRYDKEGFGVMLCARKDLDYVMDNYVMGGLEKVYSKLSSAAVLRMHCLGLVASGHCNSFKQLFEFFGKSLFSFQYKNTEEFFSLVEEVVTELKEMDFIRERPGSGLVATPVGKRVSELYVDPLSASRFVSFINDKGEKNLLDYLLVLNSATEMHPQVTVRRAEEVELFEEAEGVKFNNFLDELFENRHFLGMYKGAKLLGAWANEETEEGILEKFEVPPGLLAARLRNAVWLAYSMEELAFLLNQTSVYREARRLRHRLRHGIKEELLPICRIKGIGRVRGRKLFSAGIRSEEDYNKLSKEDIKAIYAK